MLTEITHKGVKYYTAKDVIGVALNNGYVPHISTDNRLHPGSMCNRFMHQIIMNQALRRYYSIDDNSVVKFSAQEYPAISSLILNSCDLGLKSIVDGYLDLYNENAMKALVCFLTKKSEFSMEVDHKLDIPDFVVLETKTVERKKERPILNLFKK